MDANLIDNQDSKEHEDEIPIIQQKSLKGNVFKRSREFKTKSKQIGLDQAETISVNLKPI